MQSLFNRYEQLKKEMDHLISSGLCIAFSGGVDSCLLLKVACDVAKEKGVSVYVVTFLTKLHPHGEMEEAKQFALKLGAMHDVIELDEFSDPEILNNPPDRCYRCKRMLFQTLWNYAKEKGLHTLADGTNADDLHQYRPGIRALHELGVMSPLAECGFTKADVRELSRSLNLQTSEKPSAPCLATRIPYNTPLNPDTLQKIAQGEMYLKNLGLSVVRIRLHGDITRIEVSREKFPNLLQNSDQIAKKMKSLGFLYITLDLEGFRSGSMDEKIKKDLEGSKSNG